MGWILQRKRDLRKLLIGLRRRPKSPETEEAREKIMAHSRKLDVVLEMKRKQIKDDRTYQEVRRKISSDKRFKKAARMVVESGGRVEAKLDAVEYLKSQGVPETEAYEFANSVAVLERRGYGDVLVIPRKKRK